MLDPFVLTGEAESIRQIAEQARPQVLELFPDAQRIYGGWSLKVENGHRLDMYVMIFNLRLAESKEDDWMTMGRYWCYTPRSIPAVPLAAARAWTIEAHTEPVAWVKSWDQRYNGEGPVKPRVGG